MEFSEEDSKGKEENEAVYPPYVNTAETHGYCTPEIVNTAETQGYCTQEIVNTAETQEYCTPEIDLKHDYEALRRETRTDNQHHTKPVRVISRWIKSYCAYVNLAILNVAMLGIIIFICLSKRNVGWTSWSSWDSCSHTCGEGVQSRSRSCNNPSDFGQLCAGDSLQIQPCKINRCLSACSSVPSCETKRCPAFSSLPNATMIYGYNSSDVGDTIEFICNQGFYMIGSGRVECYPNETWSTMPRCEPKDCGSPPNDTNGVVSISCGLPVVPDHVSIIHINGTDYQDVVIVNCQEGFTLQDDNMMRCSNQTIWTPIPNCTIKDCGNPSSIINGAIKDLLTTHFNSTFVIQCNEGFTASSNNSVVCDSNGQWTTIPTCNPVVCGTLVPPENGHIIFINGTAFGDVATINCDRGYILNGSQFVTCLSSSNWSDLPSCLRVDCGNPPSITNGAITGLSTTHFNSSFVVQCNGGFTASSNNSVVCDSNGQWTTVPTCNPVVCGTLVPPNNGHIIFINGTSFGDVATINCNYGYKLNGIQFVTCLSSRTWSDLPSCLLIDCGPPPPVPWSSGETTLGTKLTLQCPASRYINGSRAIECQFSGTWNSSDASCNAIETCEDLKKCNPSYTNDGHYWLYPPGISPRKLKVYCHNQATSNPTEYISVNDATNYVYDAGANNPTNQDPVMTVNFAKIRLNPKNMTIDTLDLGFAISSTGSFSGSHRPTITYGMAASCVYESGSFKIDTTGTGIIIDTSKTWTSGGYASSISGFARTNGGAIISAYCRGDCGWCIPESLTLPLQFNPDDVVPDCDVTTPQCV